MKVKPKKFSLRLNPDTLPVPIMSNEPIPWNCCDTNGDEPKKNIHFMVSKTKTLADQIDELRTEAIKSAYYLAQLKIIKTNMEEN